MTSSDNPPPLSSREDVDAYFLSPEFSTANRKRQGEAEARTAELLDDLGVVHHRSDELWVIPTFTNEIIISVTNDGSLIQLLHLVGPVNPDLSGEEELALFGEMLRTNASTMSACLAVKADQAGDRQIWGSARISAAGLTREQLQLTLYDLLRAVTLFYSGPEHHQARERQRADLTGQDLTGRDLCGRDMREQDLRNASLKDAALRGAYMVSANLENADLSGADLAGAALQWADLGNANLAGADMSGAHLYEANLAGADLQGADLSAAFLQGAQLESSNLSGAVLVGASLLPTIVRELTPDLKEEVMNRTPEEHELAQKERAALTIAVLDGTIEPDAIPHGAFLVGADLHGANLQDATMHGAALYLAQLDGADLQRADLRGANLRNVNLEGAELHGANLAGTDLTNANLQNSTFGEAASIEGATLSGATMPDGSRYDGT